MPTVRIEVRAGHIRHAALNGLVQKLERVHLLRQTRPYEQAALRRRVRRARRESRKAVQHRLQLRAIARGDALDVRPQQPLAKVAVHDRLRHQRAVQIAGLLADHAFAHQLRKRNHHRAHAHAGRNQLGEAGQIHDPALLIEALDRGNGLSGIAKVAIRVVLRDDHAVLRRQLRDALSALDCQRQARRILEGGNHVDQLGMMRPDGVLQSFRDHPLLVGRHGHDVRVIRANRLKRA